MALPKRVVILAALAAGAYLGWRKVQEQQQAEQDLWAEATDPIPNPDLR